MTTGENTSSRRAPKVIKQPWFIRWGKAAILGVVTAVIGVVLLITFGYNFEEDGGLALLFHLRGERNAPSNVVIVSLDRTSADRLGLSYDYSKWPHSYHAQLIRKLKAAGASVIAFDVFFNEPRATDDDHDLSDAISKAGNVILVEDLRKKIISASKKDSSSNSFKGITVQQLVPPTIELAQAATAVAPFPIPKVPIRVSQYWTFEQTGDVPTLPSIAYQIYSLQAFDDLKALMAKAIEDPNVVNAGDKANKLALEQARNIHSLNHDAFKNADANISLVRSLRQILGSDTLIGVDVRKYLWDDEAQFPMNQQHREILKALVNMYKNPTSRYLNFYGPPGTIKTIPYFRALQLAGKDGVSDSSMVDFKNKVVFIGYSDISPQSQGDFYNTVYSQPDGRDLSGVEIAATAFANLAKNTPIKSLTFGTNFLTILLYGFTLGLICYLLRPLLAAVYVVVASVLYVDFATLQFTTSSIWFPVMIPVAFQAPFAFTAAVLWKYYDSRKMEIAHERLREVDRLKTMFLSQVSHELRAPLTSIQGFIDNMLDGLSGELKGKQRDYLIRMQDNTERLTRMITNLLDLSRIESGTQHVEAIPWRLLELVEEVMGQFEPVARCKRVTLEVICKDSSPRILADHDKFIQILTNLVDNAIKFTPAGGKVTVSLNRLDNNNVVITIADTGVGIPAEALKNLFEPFYQASQSSGAQTKGLGLGLAIVKSLVEIHGGSISVTSELGHGSEFRIVLPDLMDGGHKTFSRAANS